jgi:hypothetical protein
MDDYVKGKGRLTREDVLEIIRKMPSSNVVNYIFSNNGGYTFTDRTKGWGMDRPSSSNGAAYADLDNDGDLDIVVNNINATAFVYQNNIKADSARHYLSVVLKGSGLNTYGIGAKVMLTSSGRRQYQEQMPARGYLSSVSPVIHFGLADQAIDTIRVTWPGGKQQVLTNVQADQSITVSQSEAAELTGEQPPRQPLFKKVTAPGYVSQAATVNDFKRQPLLIHPLSFSGPCLAKTDVNGDGLEDIFVGGSPGHAGALYVRKKDGGFTEISKAVFQKDARCQDADAIFFDANNDKHPDLYVASGGYHDFVDGDKVFQDRLYINDGRGNFTKSTDALPSILVSKGVVRAADVNGDGNMDLFVGGRTVPGRYPEIPKSFILVNDGNGKFADQTNDVAPELTSLGMITDAMWTDLSDDRIPELVLVGEWIAPTVFTIENGKLIKDTSKYFDPSHTGWWNRMAKGDFNNDGKTDFAMGNMGTNTQFVASEKEPAEMFFADQDNNGSVDPIFSFYIQGKRYPYVTRDELLEQLGSFRKRFTNYESYADVALSDLFTPEQLGGFRVLNANRMETTIYLSQPDNSYRSATLPLEAQYSPVCSIVVFDYDKDGNQDVVLAGNVARAKLRLGKFDANYGTLLKGDGRGGFEYIPQAVSGFDVRGDVRSSIVIDDVIYFGVNGQPVTAYGPVN